MDQEESSVHSPNGDKIGNELEKMMESLMNMFFVCCLCSSWMRDHVCCNEVSCNELSLMK